MSRINAGVMLKLGWETLRASNARFLLNIFGFPLLLTLGLWAFFSFKAALVVVAVQVGIFFFVLAVTATQLEKLADIRLEPWPLRSAVNRDQITRLAGDLARLGFVPAGMYRVSGRDLFTEVYAHPGYKIYAMITSGTEDTDAYVEFSSDYRDGGNYCVGGGRMGAALPRPANMVQFNYPGKSTEELLGIHLRCRPDYGLLDTPPENFLQSFEKGQAKMMDYLFKRARD